MIIEWGYSVIMHVVGWLFSLMAPQTGLDGVAVQMSTIFDPLQAGLTGLGGWIPWGIVSTCAGITLALWLVTLGMRVIKSFLPTISG